MKKRLSILILGLVVVGLFSFYNSPSFAQDNEEDLKKQIQALQKRVDELESKQSKQEKNDDSWGFFNRRRNGSWDPFEEMGQMQEEMDRLFQNSFRSRGPSKGGMFSSNMSFDYDFDIKENKDGYEIVFDMKGLDQEKVDIEINEHSITVKGEHSRQDTEEGPNRYFSSQSYGSFMKTIPLPVDADTTKVQTEKKGDSLVIKLPKKTS